MTVNTDLQIPQLYVTKLETYLKLDIHSVHM